MHRCGEVMRGSVMSGECGDAICIECAERVECAERLECGD